MISYISRASIREKKGGGELKSEAHGDSKNENCAENVFLQIECNINVLCCLERR